jgi:hypothetical protein
MLVLECLGGDGLEPLVVKQKIMDLSLQLKQTDMDSATREQLMTELVEWCEQYFALYNQLKVVPKLVI